MAKPTYRFTGMTNVQVVRRDSLTARDVAVAINEDLVMMAEVRILQTPGTSNGTATLVRRVASTNGSAKTVKPNHPFYFQVSALRHTIRQTALPYTKTKHSP